MSVQATTMEWLNYHHLYYFWIITQEGTLSRAAVKLHVTHSTLSAQLRTLEAFLGSPLFERHGRRLRLTPFGAEIEGYAAEIFRLGYELVDVARGRTKARSSVLHVGVVGAIPKTVALRLLEPALDAGHVSTVKIRQDDVSKLLEELSAQRIHVVLSDTPPPQDSVLRVHAHVLGETEILLYGEARLAKKFGREFPRHLDGAPFLLPSSGTVLRRRIERWLADRGLHVRIVGEFDDAGLLRAFGCGGRGLFPVRAALATEVEEAHAAVLLGPLEGVRERYYAISWERRVRIPGVAALIEAARERLLTRQRGIPAHVNEVTVTKPE